MKAKFSLFLLTALLCVSAAFAVNGSGYYNLVNFSSDSSSTLVLSQDSVPCNAANWQMTYRGIQYINGSGFYSNGGTNFVGPKPADGINIFAVTGSCYATFPDNPSYLSMMFGSTLWTSAYKLFTLATDIDLGGYDESTADNACNVNHVPLRMPANATFNGNGFTIKHLCYAAESMTEPVGFFGTVDSSYVANVSFDGVRIVISGKDGSSADDFYPAGPLAGKVSMATVDSATMSNVYVEAPFAGGVAGYVENATLKNVHSGTNVTVANKTVVTGIYAYATTYSALLAQNRNGYRVYLGGLAGAVLRDNADATFIDDSVSVTVIDYAEGDNAALGGVAGLFISSGDSIDNVHVYGSKISGGSAMGGLVGMAGVLMNNSNPVVGDMLFANSSFEGSITSADSSDNIAVGGLVGYDKSVAAMSVKFLNDHANVDIRDSIKKTGTYHYYAGGLLGYGAACSGYTTTDFISIYKSSSEGVIKVSGSASDVSGLQMYLSMGGLAGSACLAIENGLSNDTSSVELYANVKTAPAATYSYTTDSVNVGGFVGWANVSVSTGFSVDSSEYAGRIVVNDSLSSVHAGGLLGTFLGLSGGSSLNFKRVKLNSDSLIAVHGVATSKGEHGASISADVGGICGLCNAFSTIEEIDVTGNIVADGYVGDSLNMGGLIGSYTVTDQNSSHVISKAYVIGNMAANSTSNTKLGYLLGVGTIYLYDFNSCYHYGSSDASVDAFGLLSNGSDITSTWKTNENIRYIVRNGDAESLSDNGNGTMLLADMQKSSFAGFLNKAFDSEEDYVWSFASGKNGNLPYVNASKAVAPTDGGSNTFVVTFEDMNGGIIKSESVKEGGDATAPDSSDITAIEGYTFSGKWNGDYTNVSSDITVTAIYNINSYSVKFLAFDGTQIGDAQSVEYGASATAPEIPTREGYTATGWNDSSFVSVKKDLNVTATYKAIEYKVTFANYDGSVVISSAVAYGTIPAVPTSVTREATSEYTYKFVGWNPEVAVVSGEATYTAVYDSTAIVPESSSSAEESSSSEEVSSSSEEIAVSSSSEKVVSSSSVEPASSSSEEVPEVSSSSAEVVESSSSLIPVPSGDVESSSSAVEVEIVSPTLEQSGDAVRLSFETKGADENTYARVILKGENGIALDTMIDASVLESGAWEMVPAPVGKFSIELVLTNGASEVSYKDSFEVASEIVVQPKSWQMVSIAAMDKSLLKSDDASFYWWDETNPIGDYWQYRAYSTKDEVDATRGFWYGTTEGTPIVIHQTTGSRDSEIVWNLDSLYSGWNLVANPYGWYVSLENGKTDNGESVEFWQWDASDGYTPATTLAPYGAVWAKVHHSTTYRVSAAPEYKLTDTSKSLTKKVFAKASANGWAISVALSDENGRMDSWNVLGAGTDAETMDEPPAGMGDRVSLAIRETERGNKLAKSIRTLGDSYEWILDVSANSERNGKITFDGIEELNAAGLSLYVTLDGETSEVRAHESVNVALKKTSQKVTVSVATSAAEAIANKTISGFSTRSESGVLAVSFNAPEMLAGSAGHYALVGINGKVAARGSFTASAGTNMLNVNAPKSGIYFMQVRVGSQKMNGKVLVK